MGPDDTVDYGGFSTIKVTFVSDRAKAEIEAKSGHEAKTIQLLKPTDDSLKSLAKLPWAQKVILDYSNTLSDVTPLGTLTNLEELSVWGGKFTSVEPLGALVHLEKLSIVNANGLTDLAPLGRLGDLKDLELGEAKATDLTPIGNLQQLRKLRLVGLGSVKSLDPLKALGSLTDLNLTFMHGLDTLQPIGSPRATRASSRWPRSRRSSTSSR